MLQRVRDAVGCRVNLVHRLDRGASGCLLLTYATSDDNNNTTALLSTALADPKSCKTYLALVRGEGILHGVDLKEQGWFLVDRPIKNERGIQKDARTWFRFVAGQGDDNGDRARMSLVLARPETGRWHQIRKHLNGLSHPILGDSTHGNSKTNREWKQQRGLLPERLCLHLCRLQLVPTPRACPDGIDVTCPLALDILSLLECQMKDAYKVEQLLLEEGIRIR